MNRYFKVALALFLVALATSCSNKQEGANPSAGAAGGGIQITGAGSTFVNPLMTKWSAEYATANPNIHINYQAIGSGAGIQQVTMGTVDFGASDGPMTDEQLTGSKVGRILHVPVIMGATVAAYNLPGFTGELKLTPDLLANIFLGKITKWNDPAIAKVGNNTSVSWPTGVGAKGNDGVAGMIRQTPGALGYIEMTYADQNNIPYASIKNAAGKFIRPTAEAVAAAASSAQIPDDFRYSLTNAPGPDAYPIAGTTWVLLPVQAKDKTRGAALLAFVRWVLGPGQQYAPALHYAALPAPLVTRVEQTLGQVQ